MMSIRPKKFNVTPEKPIATRFFSCPVSYGEITFAFCGASRNGLEYSEYASGSSGETLKHVRRCSAFLGCTRVYTG